VELWLRIEAYRDWLARHPKHEGLAICTLCSKDFNVSNMAKAALKSHAKGSEHTKLAKQHSEEKSKALSRISDLWSSDSNATAVSCSKSV
jgi:hypothetical protein